MGDFVIIMALAGLVRECLIANHGYVNNIVFGENVSMKYWLAGMLQK